MIDKGQVWAIGTIPAFFIYQDENESREEKQAE
jgi:hypothetical protein